MRWPVNEAALVALTVFAWATWIIMRASDDKRSWGRVQWFAFALSWILMGLAGLVFWYWVIFSL